MGKDKLRKTKVGDHVVMTERGVQQGLVGRARSRHGVVMALRIGSGMLKVRRDGLLGASWYAREFWNPVHGSRCKPR